jgi:hypothetical protein
MYYLPTIELYKDNNFFIAHWRFFSRDYDKSENRLIPNTDQGAEAASTIKNAIVKACVTCHYTHASRVNNLSSLFPLPKITLDGDGYFAKAVDENERVVSYGHGKDAIANSLLEYIQVSYRSPDSRNPNDYGITVNGKTIYAGELAMGKATKITPLKKCPILPILMSKVNNNVTLSVKGKDVLISSLFS